jgi:NAD(P)H dehydrogenase (quinone)
MKNNSVKPILVTGVGGKVGGIGQKIVANLLQEGATVRALLFDDKEIANELEQQGVEIVMGDLTDLNDVHRAIKGCERMYFGMAVSSQYLEATVNTAAVAKYYDIQTFVNISQMTVSQMSITETTPSPQQKLQWLSEQVLNWSGLPVVDVRSTVLLENPLFYLLAQDTLKKSGELRLPFGSARTSPIAASDVAFAISKILLNPGSHIGKIYELTGAKSQTMNEIAEEYSRGLGKKITYVDIPYNEWLANELDPKGLPEHVRKHIAAMALLHQQNRYDRYTQDFKFITGREPISIEKWVSSVRNNFT